MHFRPNKEDKKVHRLFKMLCLNVRQNVPDVKPFLGK